MTSKKKAIKEKIPLFQVSEDRRHIIVPFDKHFKDRDIGYLNSFEIQRKRTYCNIIDNIVEYGNMIYEKDVNNELPVVYLLIKYHIAKRKYEKLEEFIDEVYSKLFTPYLINILNEIVDEHYELNLDVKGLEKYNAGLQFTDKHAKILLTISLAMKLMIPLIMDYSSQYELMNENLSRHILLCFDRVFKTFSPKVDMVNKLFQSVHSRVVKTKYSDNVFWFYTEIMGIGIDDFVQNLTKKITIDVIPKYSFDKNIVSLNHVVIENNIGYYLQLNFSLKYKLLNLNETEENGLSDFDKLAINITKINESVFCINKANIHLTIKRLKESRNIKITKKEYLFYKDGFTINKLQRNLLFLYFAKEFGGVENLYNCNIKQYILLLIIMKKSMEKAGFELLSELLTAKNVKSAERKVLNKKSLMKIIESPKYKSIIDTKYSYTFVKIIETGQMVQDVATIMSNKFMYYSYNDPQNGSEIKISNDQAIEEYLRFIESV